MLIRGIRGLYFECSSAPTEEDFQKRARADFLERETGGERFLLGDGAAGDAAQKEVQEALARRRVVEDIAVKRRERRLFDKRFEPAGSRGQSFEEKRIDRGVTDDELRRMKVPSFVDAVAQRVQRVVECAPPRAVDPACDRPTPAGSSVRRCPPAPT